VLKVFSILYKISKLETKSSDLKKNIVTK